jgi:flagellar protein FliS
MSYPAYATTPPAGLTLRPTPAGASAAAPRAGASYGGRPGAAPGAAPGASQAARYRDAELAATPAGQLVVMLFDKCLLTVRRAQAAFAAGDVAARGAHLCAAADMVAALRGALDLAAGGDVARQLDALYAFASRELFEATRRQDAARLGPVLHVLGELREAFAGAQAQVAAAAPAARAAAVRHA